MVRIIILKRLCENVALIVEGSHDKMETLVNNLNTSIELQNKKRANNSNVSLNQSNKKLKITNDSSFLNKSNTSFSSSVQDSDLKKPRKRRKNKKEEKPKLKKFVN